MAARIRWLWRRLTANYWFYPALFAILAAILALGLVNLDLGGATEALNDADWLLAARPDGASTMLQVIAGSMIGVAATVFSITIAAVAYASGNYGPRLLSNFMEDRGNQLSLASFIATFVYALVVLRFVRKADEAGAGDAASAFPGFVPQASMLVAYALTAISVGVLVYFLNHIPSSIRINTVLEGIGRRLLGAIERTYPDDGDEEQPDAPADGSPVTAQRAGYVQLIDFETMAEIADRHSLKLALEVRTGDFVHRGMAILRIVGSESGDDDLPGALRDCFSLGASRTPEQDPQFLIDELVEIGLRALSPGINDPFTAITALHWLGAATHDLGRRRLVKRLGTKDAGRGLVVPLADDFEHYVERGFGAIRSAVATSPIAAEVMLDTLRHAAGPLASTRRKARLREQGALLVAQARIALSGPDLEELEGNYREFERRFG